MARKQVKAKAGAKVPKSQQATVTNQVAEYIGTSLADLLNRKDALVRQLATVDQQISTARRRVAATVSQGLPALSKLVRGKVSTKAKKTKTGNRKRKRPLPPDEPMVAATERMRSAEAKGRASQRARTSLRSGNR